jgi:pimeloyl-ACP methyl ester carboxylesterase
MISFTLSDSLHLNPPKGSKSSKKYIIIFLTGNPGLIGYYFTFLAHIYSLLNQDASSNGGNTIIFEVHGSSLPGFEVDILSAGERRKQWREIGLLHDPPFSLEETIKAVEQRIIGIVKASRGDGSEDPSVILIGHSLGAFIALEIIERHRKRLEGKIVVDGEPGVVGGIGLFPGVVDLGKSESGVKLTVCNSSHIGLHTIPTNTCFHTPQLRHIPTCIDIIFHSLF